MGVEYSTKVAYGVSVLGEPPRWTHEEWYDGDVDTWLEERGYTFLATDTGGDQMSGPQRWSIICRGTLVRASKWDDSPPVTSLDEPTPTAKTQLAEAASELEFKEEPGWKMFWNVS